MSPLTLLDQKQGRVTALKMSDVGFVCAGFEGSSVTVIDLRGPAVIFDASLAKLGNSGNKRSSIRRQTVTQHGSEWPTVIEFGVMSLEGEGTIAATMALRGANKLQTIPAYCSL